MSILGKRPTSPGRRAMTVLDCEEITCDTPEESLLVRRPRTGGRNAKGRITSRFRGGGHRRRFRIIDYRRDKFEVPGRVATIEFDPARSARIALVHYADGEKRYILAPQGLKVGTQVVSGQKVEPKPGNAMPLRHIPLGLQLHNVELTAGRGGQIARSAGATVQLVAKEGEYAHLVLPSGEIRKVHLGCRATIGQVGNLEHSNVSIGKAGRKRHWGRRPHVRGMCQNPVDHPMGGGEGRSKSGKEPQSPTGVLAKGGKTRNPRKPSTKFIIRSIRKRKKRR
ncbi:MAG: 50S ribosomal protein L2 [Planctomycetes bacterium]|nr:50S ribosomal protein L2 [Planctomycetota bacterium]